MLILLLHSTQDTSYFQRLCKRHLFSKVKLIAGLFVHKKIVNEAASDFSSSSFYSSRPLQWPDGIVCRQVKGSDNGPVVSCLLETNQSQAITFKFDLREADVAAIKYKMVSIIRRGEEWRVSIVTAVLSYS